MGAQRKKSSMPRLYNYIILKRSKGQKGLAVTVCCFVWLVHWLGWLVRVSFLLVSLLVCFVFFSLLTLTYPASPPPNLMSMYEVSCSPPPPVFLLYVIACARKRNIVFNKFPRHPSIHPFNSPSLSLSLSLSFSISLQVLCSLRTYNGRKGCQIVALVGLLHHHRACGNACAIGTKPRHAAGKAFDHIEEIEDWTTVLLHNRPLATERKKKKGACYVATES